MNLGTCEKAEGLVYGRGGLVEYSNFVGFFFTTEYIRRSPTTLIVRANKQTSTLTHFKSPKGFFRATLPLGIPAVGQSNVFYIGRLRVSNNLINHNEKC